MIFESIDLKAIFLIFHIALLLDHGNVLTEMDRAEEIELRQQIDQEEVTNTEKTTMWLKWQQDDLSPSQPSFASLASTVHLVTPSRGWLFETCNTIWTTRLFTFVKNQTCFPFWESRLCHLKMGPP